MDITPILTALLQLTAAIFTILGTYILKKYLIPYLEHHLTSNELKDLKDFIQKMMEAVEQLQRNGYFDGIEEQGKAKKDWVLKEVKGYCEKYGLTFDEEIVGNLIESYIPDIS